ncbi:hypothetical protein HNY73_013200 [Argiope bruennichi]|uniref:Uncharacterized protein n=1 Tax=Argiope bruennichi TaxID=94029 RepID=A0A8T0EZF1_ARGBR|nr:hypothetical protein HNY73_013200 [Argiope bruennichi]
MCALGNDNVIVRHWTLLSLATSRRLGWGGRRLFFIYCGPKRLLIFRLCLSSEGMEIGVEWDLDEKELTLVVNKLSAAAAYPFQALRFVRWRKVNGCLACSPRQRNSFASERVLMNRRRKRFRKLAVEAEDTKIELF